MNIAVDLRPNIALIPLRELKRIKTYQATVNTGFLIVKTSVSIATTMEILVVSSDMDLFLLIIQKKMPTVFSTRLKSSIV